MNSRMCSILGAVAVLGLAAAAPAAEADKTTTGPATTKTGDQARALTADEIVRVANRVAYYQGADGRADVAMTVVDAKGQKRSRELTILRWDQPAPKSEAASQGARDEGERASRDAHTADQKSLVYFHRPADVNKTVFLVHKHAALETDDDRWLYLPALDLVKRITSADKRTRFVGTHFFYEDVSGRSPEDDTHELVETTARYHVLKHTPKRPKSVEFSHYVTYIHKKQFIVVQTDYYDKQDKKYRQYKAVGFKKIQGYPTITASRMSNLRDGSHTDAVYTNVRYDNAFSEKIFTKRSLRRPPRKALR